MWCGYGCTKSSVKFAKWEENTRQKFKLKLTTAASDKIDVMVLVLLLLFLGFSVFVGPLIGRVYVFM